MLFRKCHWKGWWKIAQRSTRREAASVTGLLHLLIQFKVQRTATQAKRQVVTLRKTSVLLFAISLRKVGVRIYGTH